ncbi:hypothetical protein SAMN04488072_10328 [Lentibacillus halodurans]|uniref:Uncharacterized protein n=1 Tax=Lentibacillus halodurans TaxID=237679 RepID=A0A1I0WGY8_9BACI|nr:hypothetical protein [Lentibacillus halodurans]SFA87834.1 hypothetical protein SAMN04488072_10328 [Lentibacillus halodurans]
MSNLHYYIIGNTAEGLINHLDPNLHNINQIITLSHPSSWLKTAIIKKLTEQYNQSNLEILESALGNDYLDGFIIRDQSLAFIDSRIATTSTANLNLEETFPAREQGMMEIHRLTQKAYDSFAKGLKVHDDLEEIYMNQMDFDHADQFAVNFIADLFHNIPKKEHTPHTYNRLFGTNTADGIVNVVPHLFENIKTVHYIKGRAGTGKSTFMKKIAGACTDHGFDVELYFCSFDPNSVDMVLVRDLDFCIFDSTDPHAFFPEREGEVIVDLYEELVPGTDEKYETEINDLNVRYKSYMKEGIGYLKMAGHHRDQIEDQYIKTITEADIGDAVQTIQLNL